MASAVCRCVALEILLGPVCVQRHREGKNTAEPHWVARKHWTPQDAECGRGSLQGSSASDSVPQLTGEDRAQGEPSQFAFEICLNLATGGVSPSPGCQHWVPPSFSQARNSHVKACACAGACSLLARLEAAPAITVQLGSPRSYP